MTRRVDWVSPQGGRAVVVGSAFGLVSEAEGVAALLKSEAFDAILLGASPEQVETIAAHAGQAPEVEPAELGPVGALYIEQMGRFGATRLPALELYDAWTRGQAAGVPVVGIDLGDAAHTEVYVREVSVLENVRKERRQLKRARGLAELARLEEFVAAWDEVFAPSKGLRAVERAREAFMARRIREEATAGRRLLVVLPLERLDGVVRDLGPPPPA